MDVECAIVPSFLLRDGFAFGIARESGGSCSMTEQDREFPRSLHSPEEEKLTLLGQIIFGDKLDLTVVDAIPTAFELPGSHVVPIVVPISHR